jgi:flagellar biogenesis protein FliO
MTIGRQLFRLWRNASELLSRAGMSAKASMSRSWKYIRTQQVARSSCKRLQVAETVSLGEKRFVAVIRVDGREFLIGGGATNVALLTQLDAKQSFDNLLTETMTVAKKSPAKRARKKIAKPPVEQAGGQV